MSPRVSPRVAHTHTNRIYPTLDHLNLAQLHLILATMRPSRPSQTALSTLLSAIRRNKPRNRTTFLVQMEVRIPTLALVALASIDSPRRLASSSSVNALSTLPPTRSFKRRLDLQRTTIRVHQPNVPISSGRSRTTTSCVNSPACHQSTRRAWSRSR